MATENKVLMMQARESLKGKWVVAITMVLVYTVIIIGLRFIPYVGALVVALVSGPITFGLTLFWINISRNHEAKLSDISAGQGRYIDLIVTKILISWFTFLWTLLLIIPGIIASISYSMTYYIMVDDPEIKPMAAINKSKAMMYGYKWKFFYLNLRFLGWALLCLLTVGIGFLWLVPYMQVSIAKFYDDIKAKDEVLVPEVIEVPKA